jgi:TRAP-type C4-dicarboxylate transport system substrate-binding protein
MLPKAETFAHFGPFVFHRWFDEGWTQWIERATGGRLQVELAEPDSIFPSAEALNAIEAGVIEAASSSIGKFGGTLPEAFILAGMPFSWPDPVIAWDWFYQYGGYELGSEAFAEHNVVYVPQIGGEILNMAVNFEATSSDTIKGRKIRIFGPMSKYIEAIDGIPVAIPYGEAYQALQLGTVDGATLGIQALEDIKLKEVVSGYVTSPIAMNPSNAHLYNMDAFNALPDDIQHIVREGSAYYLYTMGANLLNNQRLGAELAKAEYGLTFYEWTAEDAKSVRTRVVDHAWTEFASPSARTKQMVDLVAEHLGLYGLL